MVRYIIGVGNYAMRDDGIGSHVIEYIIARGLEEDFTAVDLSTRGLDVLSYFEVGTEHIVLIDCLKQVGPPGDVVVFTPDQVQTHKARMGVSTHEGDVLKVLDLAQRANLPVPPLTIMGILPERVEEGMGLSPILQTRLPDYAQKAIGLVLAPWIRQTGGTPGRQKRQTMKQDTLLTHAGRQPFDHHGVVNTPTYRASTILFPTLDALEGREKTIRYNYGRNGTPSTEDLEQAICALEGGVACFLTPSGVSAITTALLACVKAGDHVLMVDSTYAPTRHAMDRLLCRLGVDATYYDPCIGADIENLIRPETRLVFLESPGSWTFEVQDTPATVAVAQKHGLVTLMDNTWGAGYFHRPLTLGVDISVQAATKYIAGHSDVMMGTITCNERVRAQVRETVHLLGVCAGPDNVYLAQRGLRSMGVRLRQHQDNGLRVARWLAERSEVRQLLHPALPGCPGHEFWQRDFSGACGLFSFIMDPVPRPALAAMLDNMELFGMGYSWGGYESLLIPINPTPVRTATRWSVDGQVMRIHVGLEDVEDLLADLEKGFERVREVVGKGR